MGRDGRSSARALVHMTFNSYRRGSIYRHGITNCYRDFHMAQLDQHRPI